METFDEREQQYHQRLIIETCDEVKELLLAKNREYGSSFAKEDGIFAPELTAEQKLRVRIDDKLSRIRQGNRRKANEDTTNDTIGYLILLKVLDKMLEACKQGTCPEWCHDLEDRK